jgi:hypothetical protein
MTLYIWVAFFMCGYKKQISDKKKNTGTRKMGKEFQGELQT